MIRLLAAGDREPRWHHREHAPGRHRGLRRRRRHRRLASAIPAASRYYRSSGKPLQALGVVQSGAAERFDFTDTELAVCCASHSGSRMHVLTVRGILDKLGLDHSGLACGIHTPGDAEEQAWLIREGQAPSPLHNNCSGKHAGMLATAMALGAPVEGYLNPDAPGAEAHQPQPGAGDGPAAGAFPLRRGWLRRPHRRRAAAGDRHLIRAAGQPARHA